MKIRRVLIALAVAVVLCGVLANLLLPACVAAGTLVDTPSGPRAIETLNEGDAVWTEGPSGERREGRVLRRMGGWSTSFLEITVNGGATLRATDVHPIATPGGWTAAGALKAGDLLRRGAVVSVERRTALTRVYDLEVEPNPNFYAAGILVHNKSSVRASNERSACAYLRTLASAEADFRSNDLDGNQQPDFWVGDVASLYALEANGEAIRLIELGVAEADAAPLRPATAKPKSGYVFGVIPERADGTPLGEAGGLPGSGLRSADAFAFCAWPAEYGAGGRPTFIINQSGGVWMKDTGRGARLLRWPRDPKAEGWTPLD